MAHNMARTRHIAHRKRPRAHNQTESQAAQESAKAEREYLYALFAQAPAFLVLLRGPDHVYEYASPIYLKSLGRSDPSEIIGKPAREVVPEVDGQGYFEMLDHIYATGEPFMSQELPVMLDRLGNGQLDEAIFYLTIQPLRNSRGKIEGLIEHGIEITEQVRARQALQASEEKLAAELAHTEQLQRISCQLIQEDDINTLYQQIVEAAIAMMRSDMGSVQMLYPERNDLRLLAWKGFAGASADFWEWVRLDSATSCGVALATGKRVIVPDVETCEFMAGSKDLDFYRLSDIRAVQSTPLISREGRIVGMISTHWHEVHEPSKRDLQLLDVLARQAADLIERKQVEEALRQAQSQLKIALSAASIGTWTWDIPNDRLIADAKLAQLFGVEPERAAGGAPLQIFVDSIHPEDRPRVESLIAHAVETREDYEAEYRVIGANGAERWVVARGVVERDAEGNPVRFPGALTDITEQKELEKRKDEFIALASHELKTPITSLKLFAQILKKRLEAKGDSDIVKQMDRIDEQLNRLTELVQGLLDVSKMEAGKLDYSMEQVDLDALVRETMEDVQRISGKHRIVADRLEGGTVIADRERIRQALTNLLTNAVKYSPDADRVVVVAERAGREVTISVQDYGMGISKSEQGKVFDRFFRTSSSAANTYPGLGLGLYIASEIVKRHGGSIGVRSTVGKGSTFYFTLPIQSTQSY